MKKILAQKKIEYCRKKKQNLNVCKMSLLKCKLKYNNKHLNLTYMLNVDHSFTYNFA